MSILPFPWEMNYNLFYALMTLFVSVILNIMLFDNHSSISSFTQQGLIAASHIPGPRTLLDAGDTMRRAVLVPPLMELTICFSLQT